MVTISTETYQALQSENEHLRHCLAEMEEQIRKYQQSEITNRAVSLGVEQELAAYPSQMAHHDAFHQQNAMFASIIAHTPASIFVKDTGGRFLFINQQAASSLHYTPDQMIGKTDYELFPVPIVERWRENDRPILETGQPVQIEVVLHYDDGLHNFITTRFPISDEQGDIYAIGGISTDITKREQTEAAQALLQLRLHDVQKETIRNLVTPLIPIAERVIAMPLIGALDVVRAEQMLDTLLEGIARHHARVAVLDLTGVKHVDAQVAETLGQISRGVRLLGAQMVLTGVQPQVARVLIALDVDTRKIVTRSTLQEGIAYALSHSVRKLVQ